MKMDLKLGEIVEIKYYDKIIDLNYTALGYVTKWDEISGELGLSNLVAKAETTDVRRRLKRVVLWLEDDNRIVRLREEDETTEFNLGDRVELDYFKRYERVFGKRRAIPADFKLAGYVSRVQNSRELFISNIKPENETLEKCRRYGIATVNMFRLGDIKSGDIKARSLVGGK